MKALTDENDETFGFAGYAAVFDNIDLGGDRLIKGAFADSLAKRYPNNGAGVPVYWNHDTDDPFKNLGLTVSAVEDDHGLKVTGDIDTSTDIGRQVARLLKENRVNQMSFAYDIQDWAWIDDTKNDDGTYTPGCMELRKVDLYEVSICPIGMNQSTEVSAKSLFRNKKQPEDQIELLAKALQSIAESTHHTTEDQTGTPKLDAATRRLQLINL